MAYQLVHELVYCAVDKAWGMDEVDKWDEWRDEISGSPADSMPTDPQSSISKRGEKKKCEVPTVSKGIFQVL